MSSASETENVKNLKAFDKSGNDIAADFDSETGTALFSEAPAKITYDYDTGFNSVMMDVTIYFTESSTDEAGSAGTSGGGCNSAFGIMTISAGLIMLLRKRQ